MTRLVSLAIAASLALPACVDPSDETNDASDVFKLLVDCAPGVTCPVADGHTPVRVRLCLVPTRHHASTVPATVRTSTGEWQIVDVAPKTVATIDLGGTQCESPVAGAAETTGVYRELALIPGRAPGAARVEATVDRFAIAAPLLFGSAPLDETVKLRPAITDLGAASTIAVEATVRAAAGGPPSTGTRVTFATSAILPAGAVAVVFPPSVEANADGKALATLQTSTGITAVTLTATATAPEVNGMAPPSKTGMVTLTDVP